MTINRAVALGGLSFVIAFGIGVAFIRLDERSRNEVARRALAEVGIARAAEIEKQVERVFGAAVALSTSIDSAGDSSRFAELAPEILRNFPAVSMIALAPNGMISKAYPSDGVGDERPGRDVLADPREGPDVRAARDTRNFRLGGPYGRGRSGLVIVGYLPLWRSEPALGERFAGVAIASARVSDLVAASALPDLTLQGYDYALFRRGPNGSRNTFARSTELDLADHIEVAVKVPGGEWTLAIAPGQGWGYSSSYPRALALVAVFGVIVGLCVYDMVKRPETLHREVERRTRRLVEVHRQVTKEVLQRERTEQKLLHEASHDPLTGLSNRAYLLSQTAKALDLVKREPRHMFAVLVIGLDRFSLVNDSLGPSAGDVLLRGAARRLENALRPDDVTARLGGDEFGLLLLNVPDEDHARAIGDRLIAELSKPFVIDGAEMFVTASAGVVLSATDVENAEHILRDANLAIHLAKSGGGNRVEVFAREMHVKAMHRVKIEADLRLAIERDELRAFFEPVISVATGRITSFEALARWEHPEQGLVPPLVFIPVAESSGLVVQVDRAVWRAAAHRIRELHRQMPQYPPVSISVNLSARHLTEPDLVECVAQVLDTSGLSPSYFRVEITESMMMENAAAAVEILHKLKGLGIRLLLDDFGTGYSSLSYLHELPVDVLKIDRSFITQLAHGDKHAEIVRTIISLGRQLGMDVIAEGISTEDQLDRLRDLGCPYAQGWLFSRPMPGNQLESFISTQRVWTGKIATQAGRPPVRAYAKG